MALHDLRNLTKRLHVLEHHAEEVFQIGCARISQFATWDDFLVPQVDASLGA